MKKPLVMLFLLLTHLAQAQNNTPRPAGDTTRRLQELMDRQARLETDLAVLKDKQGRLAWKDLIPWVIALCSVGISFYVLRREGRYKQVSFLSEVDKMLINDPQLWRIYDQYEYEYSINNY